jgi:hypothetical protein
MHLHSAQIVHALQAPDLRFWLENWLHALNGREIHHHFAG